MIIVNKKTENPLVHSINVEVVRASDIKPKPILWLWKDWLAAGKLHILGGAPGTGKTTISLALASVVSSGGVWPDGSQSMVGNVVIWSGEDDHSDTLILRLIQAGADLNRIFFITGIKTGKVKRFFDPAIDMEPLLRKLQEIGAVHLLIIDPVVSAISGYSHKNAEVRRSLQPLVEVAGTLGCALLGITHFSKGTHGRNPVERLTGSLAFGALARIVMVVAKQQHDEGGESNWLLMRAKSNIGPDGGGFIYQLQQAELIDHPGLFSSLVVWKQAIDGTAQEWLARAERFENSSQGIKEKAMHFLAELLADGPLAQTYIQELCSNAGYSDATIKRAKEALNIKSTKEGGRLGMLNNNGYGIFLSMIL